MASTSRAADAERLLGRPHRARGAGDKSTALLAALVAYAVDRELDRGDEAESGSRAKRREQLRLVLGVDAHRALVRYDELHRGDVFARRRAWRLCRMPLPSA